MGLSGGSGFGFGVRVRGALGSRVIGQGHRSHPPKGDGCAEERRMHHRKVIGVIVYLKGDHPSEAQVQSHFS